MTEERRDGNGRRTTDDRLARIETKLDHLIDNSVSKDEFAPVKGIAYGMVTILLVALVGALVASVL